MLALNVFYFGLIWESAQPFVCSTLIFCMRRLKGSPDNRIGDISDCNRGCTLRFLLRKTLIRSSVVVQAREYLHLSPLSRPFRSHRNCLLTSFGIVLLAAATRTILTCFRSLEAGSRVGRLLSPHCGPMFSPTCGCTPCACLLSSGKF